MFSMNEITKSNLEYVKTSADYANISEIEDEAELLELINYEPCTIGIIRNQTPELCLAAITLQPYCLAYLQDQSEDLCLLAVQKNSSVAELIRELHEDLVIKMLTLNPVVIRYIEQTEERCLLAVSINSVVLHYIQNQTRDICLEAIKNNPHSIKYSKYQDEDIWRYAISLSRTVIQEIGKRHPSLQQELYEQDPSLLPHLAALPLDSLMDAIHRDCFNIKHIKNPSEEMQMAAMRINPRVFVHIDSPTVDVCNMAIESGTFQRKICVYNQMVAQIAMTVDPRYIKLILKQSLDMCEKAFDHNPKLIKYCQIQTLSMCEKAVAYDPALIQYCQRQTDDMKWLAIKHDVDLMKSIKEPNEEMSRYVVSQNPWLISYLRQTPELCNLAMSIDIQTAVVCNHVSDDQYLAVIQEGSHLEPRIPLENVRVWGAWVRANPEAILHVEFLKNNLDKRIWAAAIETDYSILSRCPSVTDEIYQLAITIHPHATQEIIQMSKNPCQRLRLRRLFC